MDEKQKEQQLLTWFDEVETEDEISELDAESTHDPFSTDDSIDDPEYTQSYSSYSSGDSNEAGPSRRKRKKRSQNSGAQPELEQAGSESSLDSDRPIEQEENVWEDTLGTPLDFTFNHASVGLTQNIESKTPGEVLELIWDGDVMDYILKKTNAYGETLNVSNRPKTRHERFKIFRKISTDELKKFFGLCLLAGQLKFRSIRDLFSFNPLYYHPIFPATMSGRRFEQILRCLNCTDGKNKDDPLHKVSWLLNKIIRSSQNIFSPPEALSLDESLLLFRGRLKFRVYIKNKKSKYGIKFYELCSNDGFVLNMEIYKGKSNREDARGSSKLNSLVLRLLEPFLDKGHHVYMDNFYNSIVLSKMLLQRKTHSTGTLRSNRKGNPKEITLAKLKPGQHVWKRNGNVYVSKWRDKRDVLSITTAYQPELIETTNRFGKKKTKPVEISRYNGNMSGIDRADQMISYYSCPRKTIRWHKKVIFHLLDIAVWNSHYLHNKSNQEKKSFKEFRNEVIKSLLGISPDQKDGREFVRTIPKGTKSIPSKNSRKNTGHVLEAIPIPGDSKKHGKYYKRCKQCYMMKKRKETAWQCRDCIGKPPLCVGKCFQDWHE